MKVIYTLGEHRNFKKKGRKGDGLMIIARRAQRELTLNLMGLSEPVVAVRNGNKTFGNVFSKRSSLPSPIILRGG